MSTDGQTAKISFGGGGHLQQMDSAVSPPSSQTPSSSGSAPLPPKKTQQEFFQSRVGEILLIHFQKVVQKECPKSHKQQQFRGEAQIGRLCLLCSWHRCLWSGAPFVVGLGWQTMNPTGPWQKGDLWNITLTLRSEYRGNDQTVSITKGFLACDSQCFGTIPSVPWQPFYGGFPFSPHPHPP